MKLLAHILAYFNRRWRRSPSPPVPIDCAPLPVEPPVSPPMIFVDRCGQVHEMDEGFCEQVANWNRIVLRTPVVRRPPVRLPETIQ